MPPTVTLSFDPAGPVFAIDAKAGMPIITATASLTGFTPAQNAASPRFEWRVTLRSTGVGCLHAMGKTTAHPDIVRITATPTFRIPFALVRGGDLTVSVTVMAGTAVLRAERHDLHVVGTNPTMVDLAATAVGAPDAFKKLMRLESQLRQFRAPGCPLFSADNRGGVGLCQLAPPDSDDQIWNWKANVVGGLALYHSKERAARAYPGKVRAGDTFRAQVKAYNDARTAAATAAARAAAKAAGQPMPTRVPVPAVVVRVPDFTAEELELDTVRGFNGYAGGVHEYRLKVDDADRLVVTLEEGETSGTAGWERIDAATRGAIYDDLGLAGNRRGDPNYVDDVMRQPSF